MEKDTPITDANKTTHGFVRHAPPPAPGQYIYCVPYELAADLERRLSSSEQKVLEVTKERDQAQFWRERHSRDSEAASRQSATNWQKWKDAESRAESLAAELERVREALRELVRLKNLKDRIDKRYRNLGYVPGAVMPRRDYALEDAEEEYERCKPLAWEAARAALSPPAGG